MSTSFTAYTCWDAQRIGQVISRQALVVDRATFLATHVPMRRLHDLKHSTVTDEAALLAELERQGEQDQHVFAVVQGMAGAGKSHLIRWLKEQYALAHRDDAVLLIARENNSLRGAIQQIIDSGILDPAQTPAHLLRLQGALEVLQPEVLAQRLLNDLQVAARTGDWAATCERLGQPSRITADKVERFLLDIHIRSYLERSDGPIDRLTRFLTVGTDDGAGREEIPGFEPGDLLLESEVINTIRRSGGYRDVIALCEELVDSRRGEDRRAWLARYLNLVLTEQAVGSATQLAAGDLRDLFNDVRRALQRQGKHLAIFVEDITAMTGVERGLIEALVTEHRSDDRVSLCRLLSVVGITDGYYADSFPDNIKDRVTHRLSLNVPDPSGGRREADLMHAPADRAELAARYLNAIRLPHARLENWLGLGARDDALPNACADCPHRGPCHAAFGAVALHPNAQGPDNTDAAQTIGLYPFNHTALDTLYAYLRDDRPRTPRTFLMDLLGHVLQAHGTAIVDRDFPPPATALAAAVNAPAMNPPAHERLVEEQAGFAAPRWRTLLLFWGDRSAYRSTTARGDLIGGLPVDVVRAFGLSPISGIAAAGGATSTQTTTPTPISRSGPAAISPVQPKPIDPKPVVMPTVQPAAVTPPIDPTRPRSKFRPVIDAWANGSPLARYEDIVDKLVDTVGTFIDWQAHSISSTQVDDYVRRRSFVIVGQSGAVLPGRRAIRLPRDTDTRDLLYALSDYHTADPPLDAAELGEHLATITYWLRSHEAAIVDFIQNPDALPVAYTDFTRALVENVACLAALGGHLTPQAATDARALYREMLSTCTGSGDTRWQGETVLKQQAGYPPEWVRLMKNVDNSSAVHTCRTQLLYILNRPQGVSTDIRYLDAGVALHYLQELIDRRWQPAPLALPEPGNDKLWSAVITVHNHLRSRFAAVMEETYTRLHQEAAQLETYLGDADSQSVFTAIQSALDTVRQVRALPNALERSHPQVTPSMVDQARRDLTVQLAHRTLPVLAASLGKKYGEWHRVCTECNVFFKLVTDQLTKTANELSTEMKRPGVQSAGREAFDAVGRQYTRLTNHLTSLFDLDIDTEKERA